ncbi:endonuclease III [Patescibacteria group bacterium]|nr:endonuclease III [Patescibacteria group bacterium]
MKNPNEVFSTFKKRYKKVPLEVFGENPYKTLISTLMSSRTKDEVTLEASKRLFNKAPTLGHLGQLEIRSIQKLIYPVGFYKTKARQLKKLASLIIADHKGLIPTNRKNLMNLPGVGGKTANLVLNRAYGKPAIAVDTHVHKISNLLGWVKTKTPEQTEKELTKILPKKYWKDINRLFVGVGRKFEKTK